MTTLVAAQADPATALIPAIPLQQNHRRLFVGVFPARELVRLTTVDYYKSNLAPDDPRQGYQRPPERSRITRIGTYLLKEFGDGLFPTAVVLAARQPLTFDSGRGALRLSAKYPLQVIDGQHRVAGLRYAIEDKGHEEIGDFAIPAVIVEVADRITEMNQFRIINGTAKSVRTDLVNSILTATASARGEDEIKDADRWKIVITKVVDRLNRDTAAPWEGRIIMPDETGLPKTSSGKIVRATSFMTSLKPIYVWLRELGFFQGKDTDEEADTIAEILSAYWQALASVTPVAFAEPHDYVIQKTPGLFSLHLLLQQHLLPVTWKARLPWSKATFVQLLKESAEITDPDFWHVSAGRASAYGSMKGFSDLAGLLIDSVQPAP